MSKVYTAEERTRINRRLLMLGIGKPALHTTSEREGIPEIAEIIKSRTWRSMGTRVTHKASSVSYDRARLVYGLLVKELHLSGAPVVAINTSAWLSLQPEDFYRKVERFVGQQHVPQVIAMFGMEESATHLATPEGVKQAAHLAYQLLEVMDRFGSTTVALLPSSGESVLLSMWPKELISQLYATSSVISC